MMTTKKSLYISALSLRPPRLCAIHFSVRRKKQGSRRDAERAEKKLCRNANTRNWGVAARVRRALKIGLNRTKSEYKK